MQVVAQLVIFVWAVSLPLFASSWRTEISADLRSLSPRDCVAALIRMNIVRPVERIRYGTGADGREIESRETLFEINPVKAFPQRLGLCHWKMGESTGDFISVLSQKVIQNSDIMPEIRTYYTELIAFILSEQLEVVVVGHEQFRLLSHGRPVVEGAWIVMEPSLYALFLKSQFKGTRSQTVEKYFSDITDLISFSNVDLQSLSVWLRNQTAYNKGASQEQMEQDLSEAGGFRLASILWSSPDPHNPPTLFVSDESRYFQEESLSKSFDATIRTNETPGGHVIEWMELKRLRNSVVRASALKQFVKSALDKLNSERALHSIYGRLPITLAEIVGGKTLIIEVPTLQAETWMNDSGNTRFTRDSEGNMTREPIDPATGQVRRSVGDGNIFQKMALAFAATKQIKIFSKIIIYDQTGERMGLFLVMPDGTVHFTMSVLGAHLSIRKHFRWFEGPMRTAK